MALLTPRFWPPVARRIKGYVSDASHHFFCGADTLISPCPGGAKARGWLVIHTGSSLFWRSGVLWDYDIRESIWIYREKTWGAVVSYKGEMSDNELHAGVPTRCLADGRWYDIKGHFSGTLCGDQVKESMPLSTESDEKDLDALTTTPRAWHETNEPLKDRNYQNCHKKQIIQTWNTWRDLASTF